MPRPRSDSRDRLVDSARRLPRRQGYQATGMAQIVAASGAPRGSIYFLFPGGKEELAVEAIRASAREFTDLIRDTAATAPDLRTFATTIAAHLTGEIETSGFTDGCPITTVTLDATPGSPALAAACRETYQAWIAAIGQALHGYAVPPTRVQSLATLMLAAVEGALVLARADQHTDPLAMVVSELLAAAEQLSAPRD